MRVRVRRSRAPPSAPGARAHEPANEHSSVIASPRVFERERALDQFLRMRCATQEREVAEAVQLGVGDLHHVKSSIPVRLRNERALCLS